MNLGAPVSKLDQTASQGYKLYLCIVCGWLYDEAVGAPSEGLAAGTRWQDVPEDWTCPDCGVGKEDFDMLEIER